MPDSQPEQKFKTDIDIYADLTVHETRRMADELKRLHYADPVSAYDSDPDVRLPDLRCYPSWMDLYPQTSDGVVAARLVHRAHKEAWQRCPGVPGTSRRELAQVAWNQELDRRLEVSLAMSGVAKAALDSIMATIKQATAPPVKEHDPMAGLDPEVFRLAREECEKAAGRMAALERIAAYTPGTVMPDVSVVGESTPEPGIEAETGRPVRVLLTTASTTSPRPGITASIDGLGYEPNNEFPMNDVDFGEFFGNLMEWALSKAFGDLEGYPGLGYTDEQIRDRVVEVNRCPEFRKDLQDMLDLAIKNDWEYSAYIIEEPAGSATYRLINITTDQKRMGVTPGPKPPDAIGQVHTHQYGLNPDPSDDDRDFARGQKEKCEFYMVVDRVGNQAVLNDQGEDVVL